MSFDNPKLNAKQFSPIKEKHFQLPIRKIHVHIPAESNMSPSWKLTDCDCDVV